ncbi:uncharacterized protein EI90DRAFT_3021364 [Cantharellus anzutake]|uniref:uncharacterized protein n=1 Tax=Cantharellus anzutake TaxID=1750568 RepID=UPI0019071CBB|nr:uncharacterized protein EI90DRAFT_3021364 [Cantharellus anzutake]KAF8317289.1 hypothetical protein EI90DRAFT_3021364 [Cantharellus anzutake]
MRLERPSFGLHARRTTRNCNLSSVGDHTFGGLDPRVREVPPTLYLLLRACELKSAIEPSVPYLDQATKQWWECGDTIRCRKVADSLDASGRSPLDERLRVYGGSCRSEQPCWFPWVHLTTLLLRESCNGTQTSLSICFISGRSGKFEGFDLGSRFIRLGAKIRIRYWGGPSLRWEVMIDGVGLDESGRNWDRDARGFDAKKAEIA